MSAQEALESQIRARLSSGNGLSELQPDVDRVRGIETGAGDFLTLPINQVELPARVRTLRRLDAARRTKGHA